jgi:hypothetical protein
MCIDDDGSGDAKSIPVGYNFGLDHSIEDIPRGTTTHGQMRFATRGLLVKKIMGPFFRLELCRNRPTNNPARRTAWCSAKIPSLAGG